MQYTPPQWPPVKWCSKYFVLSFFLYQFQLAISVVMGSLRRVPSFRFCCGVCCVTVCRKEDYVKREKMNAGIVYGYRILCTTMPRINWLLLNVFHFRRWAFSLTKSILLHFVSLLFICRIVDILCFRFIRTNAPARKTYKHTHAHAHTHTNFNQLAKASFVRFYHQCHSSEKKKRNEMK